MCYNYFCNAGAIMYIGMPQLYEYDDILNKNDISEFVKKYNINITLHFLEKCLPILKKLL